MRMNCSVPSLARTGRTLLVLGFSLAAVASAKAQGTPEQRAACTGDALRLCSSEIPNVARVTACMRANQARLSERCRIAFIGASPRHAERASSRSAYAGSRYSYRHSRRGTVVAYRSGHHRYYRHRGFGQYGQGMAMAMQVMGALSQSGIMNGMGGGFMGGGDRGGNSGGSFMNAGVAQQFMQGGGFMNGAGGYMNSGMAQSLMSGGMGGFMNGGSGGYMNAGMAQSMIQSFMR